MKTNLLFNRFLHDQHVLERLTLKLPYNGVTAKQLFSTVELLSLWLIPLSIHNFISTTCEMIDFPISSAGIVFFFFTSKQEYRYEGMAYTKRLSIDVTNSIQDTDNKKHDKNKRKGNLLNLNLCRYKRIKFVF